MNKLMGIIFFLAIALLSGCNHQNNNAMDKNIASGQSDIINVKNSVTNTIDPKSGQQIAKHLVDIASNIPNVNDASAVVAGKYAVVGIDVDSKLDHSRVGTIKYTVAEALKKDPYGANAVVVADADTVVRLKQMGKDIQNGKPISGILNQLAEIVGRVVPEVPNDIIKNKNPNPIKENKSQLNQQENNKLQNEQQDQSNQK